MLPKFLRPEVWPYASVEIVRADTPITAAAFHEFLTAPTTGPTLDALLEDFAAIDADQRAHDDAHADDEQGDACSAACGFCGRCS
jgi:hypothetical protein